MKYSSKIESELGLDFYDEVCLSNSSVGHGKQCVGMVMW